MVRMKHPRHGLIRSAMIGVALLLAACAEEPKTWPGSVAFQPDIAYCYVTLANVDCFGNPEPGQRYRQVGRAVSAPH